jgi:O-antigen ligase
VTTYGLGGTSSARQQISRERKRWYSAYITLMLVGAILAGLAWRSAPDAFSIAIAALLVTAAAWVVKPIVGMHLTILFTLFGDSVTTAWFPFTKNLSSKESLLYVADQINFSPLELILVFAVICWFVRHFARHDHHIVRGPALVPLLVFTGFVVVGFMYGVSRGGDIRVAVYESRGLLYLPIVYFLVSNTCHTARQYRAMLWTAMWGVLGQSIMALIYFAQLSATERKALEDLGELGASVAIDALIIFTLATLLFAGSARRTKFLLVAMLLPTGYTYLLAQRRAAIVGLGVGLIALFVVLFWRQRRTFWKVVPFFTLAAVGYLGAFWNSTGTAGFPAQAIKTVIAPGAISAKDQSSDIYRLIENADLNATIRDSPLTGLGFGQPFHQPITLPDISFFEFYRFIPHNSILWIWIKTGIFGFASMFFLFGRTLAVGARKIRQLSSAADVTVVVTATLFVMMYAIFAYVDIAWDARGAVFLGFAIAVCANFPVPVAPLRESPTEVGDEDHTIDGAVSERTLVTT